MVVTPRTTDELGDEDEDVLQQTQAMVRRSDHTADGEVIALEPTSGPEDHEDPEEPEGSQAGWANVALAVVSGLDGAVALTLCDKLECRCCPTTVVAHSSPTGIPTAVATEDSSDDSQTTATTTPTTDDATVTDDFFEASTGAEVKVSIDPVTRFITSTVAVSEPRVIPAGGSIVTPSEVQASPAGISRTV